MELFTLWEGTCSSGREFSSLCLKREDLKQTEMMQERKPGTPSRMNMDLLLSVRMEGFSWSPNCQTFIVASSFYCF